MAEDVGLLSVVMGGRGRWWRRQWRPRLGEVEELGDGEDLPAAGAAAAVADPAGEQVAVWASAFAEQPLAAAGALVNPDRGSGGTGRKRRRHGWCQRSPLAVGRLTASGGTKAPGAPGGQL